MVKVLKLATPDKVKGMKRNGHLLLCEAPKSNRETEIDAHGLKRQIRDEIYFAMRHTFLMYEYNLIQTSPDTRLPKPRAGGQEQRIQNSK